MWITTTENKPSINIRPSLNDFNHCGGFLWLCRRSGMQDQRKIRQIKFGFRFVSGHDDILAPSNRRAYENEKTDSNSIGSAYDSGISGCVFN